MVVQEYREHINRFVEGQFAVYVRKNADYGDSCLRGIKKFGLASLGVRLFDKINRFKKLSESEALVEDEKIEDTILDFFNYCAIYSSYNPISRVIDSDEVYNQMIILASDLVEAKCFKTTKLLGVLEMLNLYDGEEDILLLVKLKELIIKC